jgi:hypothetical protein
MVSYGVAGVFSGHWHRYQPSQLGAGGNTWETIIGTSGGWQGFEPIRPYQQVHGFLIVTVDGGQVDATFYGDEDGDGDYDDPLDQYTMVWAGEEPRGLVARYTFNDNNANRPHPRKISWRCRARRCWGLRECSQSRWGWRHR